MTEGTDSRSSIDAEGGARVHDPVGLESLLDFLRRTRGFDLGPYKRSSLSRRLEERMRRVGIDSYAGYVAYLERRPEEVFRLAQTVLIHVTGFFRDPPAWARLAPRLRALFDARRSEGEPVRIWSAGCASGEEAWSLAILVAEAVGIDACAERAVVHATDIDDAALDRARAARYSAKSVANVPPKILAKYFVPDPRVHELEPALRTAVVWARHDLVRDPPFSGVDLLVCRNTLMYFNVEAKREVVRRLHAALVPGGILFVGRAEMPVAPAGLFVPIDLGARVFVRASRREDREGRETEEATS